MEEVWREKEKISWPSRDEVVNLTIVVIISTLIVATYLGVADFALSQGIQALIQLSQ